MHRISLAAVFCWLFGLFLLLGGDLASGDAISAARIQAEVAEGLSVSLPTQRAIVSHFERVGRWARTGADAGERSAAGGRNVARIEIRDGTIDIVYGRAAAAAIRDHVLSLRPIVTGTRTEWVCGNRPPPVGTAGPASGANRTTIPPQFLPAGCRGTPVNSGKPNTPPLAWPAPLWAGMVGGWYGEGKDGPGAAAKACDEYFEVFLDGAMVFVDWPGEAWLLPDTRWVAVGEGQFASGERLDERFSLKLMGAEVRLLRWRNGQEPTVEKRFFRSSPCRRPATQADGAPVVQPQDVRVMQARLAGRWVELTAATRCSSALTFAPTGRGDWMASGPAGRVIWGLDRGAWQLSRIPIVGKPTRYGFAVAGNQLRLGPIDATDHPREFMRDFGQCPNGPRLGTAFPATSR